MEFISSLPKDITVALITTVIVSVISIIVKLIGKIDPVNVVIFIFSGPFRRCGFKAAYKNFNAALTAIKRSLKKSGTLRILSNRGNEWFASGGTALTQDIEKRRDGSLTMKVMLLDERAPWITSWYEGHPEKDGKIEFLSAAHRLVEAFRQKNRRVLLPESEIVYHREAPCWRILLTDNRVFISSYAGTRSARDETVLSCKGPDSSWYQAADRYFKSLEQKYTENNTKTSPCK